MHDQGVWLGCTWTHHTDFCDVWSTCLIAFSQNIPCMEKGVVNSLFSWVSWVNSQLSLQLHSQITQQSLNKYTLCVHSGTLHVHSVTIHVHCGHATKNTVHITWGNKLLCVCVCVHVCQTHEGVGVLYVRTQMYGCVWGGEGVLTYTRGKSMSGTE